MLRRMARSCLTAAGMAPALSAVALCAWTATANATETLETAQTPEPVLFATDAIPWEVHPSGVRVAVLYGDAQAAGPFVLRLQYPPGYEKGPHYHPGDAFVTVLTGAYSRGYGATVDVDAAFALTPGTFSVNPAGVSHYEWTDAGASLQVFAHGPWTTVYVDSDDRPTDAPEARPTSNEVPRVVPQDDLKWAQVGAKRRTARILGDPQEAGHFVVRADLQAGHREEPHVHPTDAFVTVLAGNMQLGFGNHFDSEKMKQLSAGSFFFIPANTPHYERNEGSVEIELQATGPWASVDVGSTPRRAEKSTR